MRPLRLISVTTLSAQTSSGGAIGTVADGSGAVLPGATVTPTNQGTKIANSAVTNASGHFVFVNVQPGTRALVSYTWSKPIDTASGYFGVENGAGSRSGAPSGTSIGQAGAGQVTSIAGAPRQIQLGARVVF